MKKLQKLKFAKGRPLFKYTILLVAFTVAVLVDGKYADQRLAQASDFGVLSYNNRNSNNTPEYKIFSSITRINDFDLDDPNITGSKISNDDSVNVEVNELSNENKVNSQENLDDIESENNTIDTTESACQNTNSLSQYCVSPTPNPTTTLSPTTTPEPSTTPVSAPVCGNNICELNEYIPCPSGTECIWIGSCPEDCGYSPEPPKGHVCGNNICEAGEADFEDCPVCESETICPLRPCIFKPGTCAGDCE